MIHSVLIILALMLFLEGGWEFSRRGAEIKTQRA